MKVLANLWERGIFLENKNGPSNMKWGRGQIERRAIAREPMCPYVPRSVSHLNLYEANSSMNESYGSYMHECMSLSQREKEICGFHGCD